MAQIPSSNQVHHTAWELRELEKQHASKWRADFAPRDLGPFHLAYVSDRLCLFHRAGLASLEPAAWTALGAIAAELGAALCIDRRERSQHVALDRRRVALAMTVAAGLMTRLPAATAESLQREAGHHQEVVAVISERADPDAGALRLPEARRGVATQVVERTANGQLRIGRASLDSTRRLDGQTGLRDCIRPAATEPCVSSNTTLAAQVERMLLKRIDGNASASVRQDLADVAAYYSQHPEVMDLLHRLDDYDWRLVPTSGTWLTESRIRGNSVVGVTVRFDLGTAAQMHFASGCSHQPACTAIPADALLHELLHVYLISTAPEDFLRSARESYYPHDHEREVIALENRLYRVMEARDGLPRPARNSHAGHLTNVDCPLCWTRVAQNP